MTDYERLIRTLAEGRVEFIIVGGLAAVAHGSARLTQDVDVVYSRSAENVRRLVDALRPLQPYLRGAPPNLPFRWDEASVRRGLNFTLTTTVGDLDLLGEITAGGGYQALLPQSMMLKLFGCECRCLALEPLIRIKRAVGRPKDLEALAELETLLEESGRAGPEKSG